MFLGFLELLSTNFIFLPFFELFYNILFVKAHDITPSFTILV